MDSLNKGNKINCNICKILEGIKSLENSSTEKQLNSLLAPFKSALTRRVIWRLNLPLLLCLQVIEKMMDILRQNFCELPTSFILLAFKASFNFKTYIFRLLQRFQFMAVIIQFH